MKSMLLLIAAILLGTTVASPRSDEFEDKKDGLDEVFDEKLDGDKDDLENKNDVMTDEEFDEEVFMSMRDDRKKLRDLSSEEVASEIREMVSLIDRDGDGLLDKDEVMAYLIRLSQHNNRKQTMRIFEKNDVNGDGVVSFKELWSHSEDGDVPDSGDMDTYQLSTKAKFNSADSDGDGNLNMEELGVFVHPQLHDHMIQHLIKDQLTVHDKNNDGKISRSEYLRSFNLEDLPEKELPDWVEDEKSQFDHVMDINHDGHLDADEMHQWIVPDDDTLYRVETKHLFYNADTNGDGKLSVEEIEERFEVFIDSSITNNGYAVHEEL